MKLGSRNILEPERLGVTEQLVEKTVIVVKASLEKWRLVLFEQVDEEATHVNYPRVVRQRRE